jgi:hypothetical protein
MSFVYFINSKLKMIFKLIIIIIKIIIIITKITKITIIIYMT